MSKKTTRLIVEVLLSILTAFATALGTTSCMGALGMAHSALL